MPAGSPVLPFDKVHITLAPMRISIRFAGNLLTFMWVKA